MLFGRDSAHRTGRRGEEIAAQYLFERGLTELARNYRSPRGEIDLIMQERDCIVFVEVRSRRSARYGSPAETIGMGKQRRIILTAWHYLKTHAGARGRPARFDVVLISPERQNLRIEWIRDAFQSQ